MAVYFELSDGQVNDIGHAESLIANARQACLICADKGYDSESLRDYIKRIFHVK
ncbi:transposase [Idiomarina aminovorans]|uniref:transposase n=1 Tax=Idiomarina aminovorans TaxID=2914829 RepID=UPI003FF08978